MMPAQLPAAWRAAAVVFREHEQTSLAIAYERCANQLEAALGDVRDEPLSLQEAATLGGYSAEHLGRLVRDGKIPNAGRKGAPRIARKDVPIKAGKVASGPHVREIDREQVVRFAITEGVG